MPLQYYSKRQHRSAQMLLVPSAQMKGVTQPARCRAASATSFGVSGAGPLVSAYVGGQNRARQILSRWCRSMGFVRRSIHKAGKRHCRRLTAAVLAAAGAMVLAASIAACGTGASSVLNTPAPTSTASTASTASNIHSVGGDTNGLAPSAAVGSPTQPQLGITPPPTGPPSPSPSSTCSQTSPASPTATSPTATTPPAASQDCSSPPVGSPS